jgi:DNA-binding HxlR family transcriptional regulator
MSNSLYSVLSQGAWWTLNKEFSKKYGLYQALLISDLGQRWEYFNIKGMLDGGYFFADMKQIEEDTGISPYMQKECHKTLEKLGVLKVRRKKSTPPRLEYMVDIKKLNSVLINLLENK